MNFVKNKSLTIGPLRGGGIVLGYRCSSRCRHCLYGCGPHRTDGDPVDEAAIDVLLDQLAQKAPNAQYHVGGGEPFLDFERLALVLDRISQHRLRLDYVETNAVWVQDRDHAEHTLDQLAKTGLSCVMVSLSPFHAEFVPLKRTLCLIAAAEKILSGGAFVWIPDFIPELLNYPEEERLDFDSLIVTKGENYLRQLAERYALIPGGRAGRYLYTSGVKVPWQEAARTVNCQARLMDTTHFHVDFQGQYVPGLCAGLVLPLESLPGPIPLDHYPILETLVAGGPAALVEMAAKDGFEPHATYGSACDLCTHVRFFLYSRSKFSELGPAGFYDPRSVDYSDAH